MLINFNEAVPIPINRSGAETGAVLTTIQEKKIKVRAVLVNHLRKQISGKDSLKRLKKMKKLKGQKRLKKYPRFAFGAP